MERSTRERLLKAATDVFVERGYAAATVREICRRASANVAAVNYHFGSKERLYAFMLEEHLEDAYGRYPLDRGLPENPTPEERLGVFIHNFLRRVMAADTPQDVAYGKLIVKEIIDPSPAFDGIVQTYMKPIREEIDIVVRSFLGPEATSAHVQMCSSGTVGQILYWWQNRAILERVYPELAFDDAGIERIAASINMFCLEAIRGIKARLAGGKA